MKAGVDPSIWLRGQSGPARGEDPTGEAGAKDEKEKYVRRGM
jgi:hypothetical protein